MIFNTATISKLNKMQHPGLEFKERIISHNNLSVSGTAELLGVTRVTLSKILNGHGAITPNIALRIEKVFGEKADEWLMLQRQYDLSREKEAFKANPPILKKFKCVIL
jgi:addiction module HigA family antidote